MKIVILDGFTANPGDLSWDGLKSLGELTVYDRTPPHLTIRRCADADIVLTNKVLFDAATINALPRLKLICVLATGYNVVDTAAAAARSVLVTNIPAYSTDSVVQLVFAHLFNITNHLAWHADSVRSGRWVNSIDFCYWDFPLIEVAGLSMGIIGFGRIGKAVAAVASAFGINVIVHTRTPPASLPPQYRFAELDDLLRLSDIVSLHCPLTDRTKHIINRRTLSLMKPSAFLINTGRGHLVEENDLADALNTGRIAAAGLDVLSTEPPMPSNPLLCAKNCYITPHIAWATRASRKRLIDTAVENCCRFVAGSPVNLVNVPPHH